VQVHFVHQLSILGEAASRVSPAFREDHPQLPWRQMTGMRSILVHGCFTVDLGAVWGVIERDLPPLRSEPDRILASETTD
jgi:uncharacterized protein with HEPN domain